MATQRLCTEGTQVISIDLHLRWTPFYEHLSAGFIGMSITDGGIRRKSGTERDKRMYSEMLDKLVALKSFLRVFTGRRGNICFPFTGR